MNKIDTVFKQGRKKALIGFVTTGYPDVSTTLKAASVMAENGCDIIELGIPFSDPIGDGPVIQQASYTALKNGVNMDVCLKTAEKLSTRVSVPLVFMSYFNPVMHYGIDRFALNSATAGISGIIIPDLLADESSSMHEACKAAGLYLIYMLAPTSNEKRIRLAAGNAAGFIYLIAMTGVTGASAACAPGLPGLIENIRAITPVPVCAGFGISSAEQVKQLAPLVNGVIIGSRIIRLIEEDPSLNKLGRFIKEIRNTLDNS